MENWITIMLPIITIIVVHILNSRKIDAEIRRIELDGKSAAEEAGIVKAKGDADVDRYISNTVMDLVERLSKRLELVEKRYDETRAKVENERDLYSRQIDCLVVETKLLKEQLEKAVTERKTAEAKLSAALDLARRYRLIASDLYQQLIDECIVPRHVLENCDELDAQLE